MHTVSSFDADAVAPEELSAIVDDYLALERLRIFRRLLVTRFAILMACAATAGWLWLSTVATYIAAGLCLVPPLYVFMLEVARERQLAQKLEHIPDQRTVVVPRPATPVEQRKL